MNPSLDLFGAAQELHDDRKSRCDESAREPGGGGINVARNLQRMGDSALAVFPAGGVNGDLLRKLMTDNHTPFRSPDIAGETRQSVIITEKSSKKMYHLVFPGPQLQESEWQECLSVVKTIEPAPEFLVLSGSMPEGVPSDFFGQLATHAAGNGIKVILDTSEPSLRPCLDAGVYLAKLNRTEFSELGFSVDTDHKTLITDMRSLVAKGAAEVLIVTLGSKGAALVSKDGKTLHFTSPPTDIVSHVGAGDAFLSALVHHLHRGNSLEEAFRYGVAGAATAIQTTGNQLYDLDLLEDVYNKTC
jgi:6-phosphofructokinase 2